MIGPTTEDALADLLVGNARFVAGTPQYPHQDASRRQATATGQQPFALVLGCSDSRVPVEVVFDQGLGDLFVVRTAGHVVDGGVLGTIEFGVGVLGVALIVVLGHDSCGAVKATLQSHETGEALGGHLSTIAELVTPSVLAARDRGVTEVDDVVAEHASHTAATLIERSPVVAQHVAGGRLRVVAATYGLADGAVRLLAPHTP